MRCEDLRSMLPALVDEPLHLGYGHVRRCRECRLALERYEELHDALAALAAHTVELPPEQVEALLAELSRHHHARRAAYLGGIAAAAAATAGAASALVLSARSRRGRLLAS